MSDQAPKILKLVILMASILWGMVLSSCTEKSDPQPQAFSWDFEGFDLSTNAFQVCNSAKSEKETFLKFFSEGPYTIPGDPKPDALPSFFEEIRKGYSQKTDNLDYSLIKREYHTLTHAMDVMISTHAILNGVLGNFLKPEEKAILLLAALGHDVLHTGVNNGFLVKIKHPIVQEFGEGGSQEKRSAQFMEEILIKYAILKKSNPKEFVELSRFLTQTILWTDFSKHKELMIQVEKLTPRIEEILADSKVTGEFPQSGSPAQLDEQRRVILSTKFSSEERILLASFILHCADISNPGKDWPVCERWANLVMNEFFAQGDLEKNLGMVPSMNCDRELVSIAKCQVGFGQYVVKDLFNLLEKISPNEGKFLSQNLEKNQVKWKVLLESN